MTGWLALALFYLISDCGSDQGELEGGRICFWHWKDIDLICTYARNKLEKTAAEHWVDTSLPLPLSDFAYWIMDAQYFALTNWIQNFNFIVHAETSFSLLLILLGSSSETEKDKWLSSVCTCCRNDVSFRQNIWYSYNTSPRYQAHKYYMAIFMGSVSLDKTIF